MLASVNAFLAGFDANQRFLKIRWISDMQVDPALHWTDALCPASFKGSEALDTGFAGHLRCFLPAGAYPFERLLGQTLAVAYPTQWGVRQHVGLVGAVSVEGESGGYLWLAISLQDGFTLLKQNKASRVFNELNALQITELVFERLAQQSTAFARLIRLDTQALVAGLAAQSCPPMAFTLQYEESDFAFLSRLWQREGWHWHIESRQVENTCFQALVLSAQTACWSTLPGVRFHRSHATELSDTVQSFQRRTVLTASQADAACFDYRQPQPVQRACADIEGACTAFTGVLEARSFLDNGAATDANRLEHLTQALAAQAAGKPVVFEGQGNVRHFAVGTVFNWESAYGFEAFHPVFETEGAGYAITALKVEVNNSFSEKHATADVVYANTFSAVPVNCPFGYDTLAQIPRLFTLTATVTGEDADGSAGAEASGLQGVGSVFTDELGRIKVRFHFSGLQANAPHQTAFLRVAQAAASQGYGHVWLPRVGDEVVVQFMGGHPDRPMVMGSVYNAANLPAAAGNLAHLPYDAALSGIRTRVLPGEACGVSAGSDEGAGLQFARARQGSELVFDDTPGHLQLRLACDVADTRLALGAVTTPRQQGLASLRGVGWEIQTQGVGSVRAGAGVLLSTFAADGHGPLMALAPLLAQWRAQRAVDDALLKQAQQRCGGSTSLPVQAFVPEPTAGDAMVSFRQPALVQHSAAGWYAAATGELALSSGGLMSQRSGADMLLMTQGRLSLNAQKGLALYAASGGIRLQSEAEGLLLQAFSGALEIQAAGAVEITSSEQGVSLRAAKFVELQSGGARIRLSNGAIEIHAPAGLDLRGSTKKMGAKAQAVAPLPELKPQQAAAIDRGQHVTAHALAGAALPKGHRLLRYTKKEGVLLPHASQSFGAATGQNNASLTLREKVRNEHAQEKVLVGQGGWQSVFENRQAQVRSEVTEKVWKSVEVEGQEGGYE
ncbi:MAG: type VI secretion system tip protein VgrG [Burkholderiales bacterium]|nr:type VI secretion system tip protein VgrG [Burkholderiales bacterium]